MYYYGGGYNNGYNSNCCCGNSGTYTYPMYGYGYGGGYGYGAAIILVLFILLVIIIGTRITVQFKGNIPFIFFLLCVIIYQQGRDIVLLTKDILDEKDKHLRKKNIDCTFPLSDEEKKLIDDMLEHLYLSQIEEMAEKYCLRPGMGLAAPQVGVNKRFFVVCHEEEEDVFKNYVLVNPKLVSHSEELIYSSGGEGCLSVNREVEGIVPRYARVTFEAYDVNGKKHKIRS